MSEATFTLIDAGAIVQTSEEQARERARRAEAAGRPVALDLDERAAYVGVSATDRGARLAALEAPDFTLPDLAGVRHSLSDHRGRKVFLVAYASW